MSAQKPLDDLRHLLEQLPRRDEAAVAAIKSRLHGAEGAGLESTCAENASAENTGTPYSATKLIEWLAGWQGQTKPRMKEVHICVLASAYSTAPAIDDVMSFISDASKGKTQLNQLCKDRGAGLRVLEMAPSVPHDINADWNERDCMAATAFGMEAAAAGGDFLGLTAISPGSAAVSQRLIEKIMAEFPHGRREGGMDSLDMLRMYGGREIAGLVGAFLAARSRRLPVLIEGWPATAAFVVLHYLDPRATEHIHIAAVSEEAQSEVLSRLDKVPLLGFQQNLGAGCGLALAASLLNSLVLLTE